MSRTLKILAVATLGLVATACSSSYGHDASGRYGGSAAYEGYGHSTGAYYGGSAAYGYEEHYAGSARYGSGSSCDYSHPSCGVFVVPVYQTQIETVVEKQPLVCPAGTTLSADGTYCLKTEIRTETVTVEKPVYIEKEYPKPKHPPTTWKPPRK